MAGSSLARDVLTHLPQPGWSLAFPGWSLAFPGRPRPSGAMTLPIVRLIPRQTHRCLNGHPWVFRSELEPAALTDIADAAEIEVQDHRSRLIGRGFYSAQSQIAVRLATRRAIPLDRAFLRTRLQAAINHRATVMPGRSACRGGTGTSRSPRRRLTCSSARPWT